jgi:hypothetical protein
MVKTAKTKRSVSAAGATREFYQIGISANKTGISVYILGLGDKNYLPRTYGTKLGKASVTGYCIRFKTLKEINVEKLEAAIRDGFEAQNDSGEYLSPGSSQPKSG